MKKFFILFLFFVFSGCYIKREIQIELPGGNEKFNNNLNSVVALVKKDENGDLEIPNCTGFFISETDIITAAHCVLEYNETIILTPEGFKQDIVFEDEKKSIGREIYFITKQEHIKWINLNGTKTNPKYYKSRIISVLSPENNDLALLRIVGNDFKSKNFLNIRNWNKLKPEIGETVFVIGHPGGNPWVLTKGIISKISISIKRGMFILHDAKIAEGSSGSPLLDINGDVVAINNKYLGDNNFLSVAVPSIVIEKLYK